ncbi:DUF3329 domain-containing protein [Pelagibacterium lentulum]|uniref:DUF3329 domain-containing protein n=1 Tax=Pelagibacterium lentulum TaxID=2029865 RepID=A0A916W1T0_9HYPH|nr:DUF3329 domain-containing protein [Pelagibacterium lentulum]GGA59571.1 hypothetical protein GCM10011499_32170 [Pelagibacterium lentulum]
MSNDINHPWLQPLWRRVLIVAICAAIALWDISRGDFGWALIFGGMAAYGIYIFFIAWNKNETAEKPDEDADPK